MADRIDPRGLSGQVFLDGHRPPPSFKYIVGYVVQDDIISGTLTVRENLMFSANVRLPNDVSANEREALVTKIIIDLGLESCADTIVGTKLLRGISGGERKRMCIGMELVLSPKILFLDEPSTGLYCRKLLKYPEALTHNPFSILKKLQQFVSCCTVKNSSSIKAKRVLPFGTQEELYCYHIEGICTGSCQKSLHRKAKNRSFEQITLHLQNIRTKC